MNTIFELWSEHVGESEQISIQVMLDGSMREYPVSDILPSENGGVDIHFMDNEDPSIIYVLKHTPNQCQLFNQGDCAALGYDDGGFKVLKDGQLTPLIGP